MTPAAATLLAELTHRGVELAAVGDRLRYRPVEAVTTELRADLIHHKHDLLALVQRMGAPPLPEGTWGRCASALLARISDDEKQAALREAFEERAGICQYDGNLSTDEAERIAFLQLCRAVASEARVGVFGWWTGTGVALASGPLARLAGIAPWCLASCSASCKISGCERGHPHPISHRTRRCQGRQRAVAAGVRTAPRAGGKASLK